MCSLTVRLQLPLKSEVRGWKSLNDDHKNTLIVDITKQFRRNVGFKSIKETEVVKEKNGGMVYRFEVIVTVLLANDNMMTSTGRYIDTGNLTTEDKTRLELQFTLVI